METLLQLTQDFYNDLFQGKSDPRVKGWPMMDSPLPILFLGIVYIHFVKYSGPQIMKKKQPLKIEKIMVIYNTAQVIVNAFAVYQGIKLLMHPSYNIKCSPLSQETTPYHIKSVYLTYIYFVIKVTDLLDTVFMVIRKNFHQVTFLHVYHHLGMVWGSWIVVKFTPGAHLCFIGLLNCAVHTVMYFYYLLTAYDSSVKKSIWWKKHITELQLIQFGLALIHHSAALFNPYCDYPKKALIIYISQVLLMIYLFSQFYYNNYIKPKNKSS